MLFNVSVPEFANNLSCIVCMHVTRLLSALKLIINITNTLIKSSVELVNGRVRPPDELLGVLASVLDQPK